MTAAPPAARDSSAKRHNIPEIKDWPVIHYEMAFRKTIDLEAQEKILAEIKKTESFRVWLAVKWLCTYISIRPAEMISLTEGQVDRERGLLIIPSPKEKRPKIVPLTEEDLILSRSFPSSFPDLKFFRNDGTKHSTAMAMRGLASYEEVRSMTGHSTNKAFERCYRMEGALKDLYSLRSQAVQSSVVADNADNGLTRKNTPPQKAKILKIKG